MCFKHTSGSQVLNTELNALLVIIRAKFHIMFLRVVMKLKIY